MGNQRRKSVVVSSERPIKTTISLDVELYSRLCALAARRRKGMSALATEFIRAGLRGVVVIDRTSESGAVKIADRQTEGLGVISTEDNAA